MDEREYLEHLEAIGRYITSVDKVQVGRDISLTMFYEISKPSWHATYLDILYLTSPLPLLVSLVNHHSYTSIILTLHVMSCHVMSCHVMSCLVMSCHVMSCHVMSCHVMSCHVISCHDTLIFILNFILTHTLTPGILCTLSSLSHSLSICLSFVHCLSYTFLFPLFYPPPTPSPTLTSCLNSNRTLKRKYLSQESVLMPTSDMLSELP